MTIALYSSSNTPVGTTIYTFVGVTVPTQYVPRLVATTALNAAGTNTDYKINVDYPIVTTVDGVNTALNTFRIRFNYTSLRSVINDVERARILREFLDYCEQNFEHICEGNVLPQV